MSDNEQYAPEWGTPERKRFLQRLLKRWLEEKNVKVHPKTRLTIAEKLTLIGLTTDDVDKLMSSDKA